MANLTASSNCTCPSPDDLKPLSWQNAFWSLTALALNAMAQVSTADGNDAEIAFSLWRCSPVVCFAEILVMIIWAVIGFYHGNTFRDCLSMSRQHLLSANKRVLDANGPSNFIALIFFVLVPLPQILKIMASTGIPWTKAWAMAYFLVSVLTFPVVQHRTDLDRWQIPTSVETKLIKLSDRLYQLCLASYIAPWTIWTISWTSFCYRFFSMSMVMVSWRWPFCMPGFLLAIEFGAFLLPIGFAALGAAFIDVISRSAYRLRGEQLNSVVWSPHWMENVGEPGSWNVSVLWGLVWAFWHLVAGVVWYSNFYDESSTTKPLWVERLG